MELNSCNINLNCSIIARNPDVSDTTADHKSDGRWLPKNVFRIHPFYSLHPPKSSLYDCAFAKRNVLFVDVVGQFVFNKIFNQIADCRC